MPSLADPLAFQHAIEHVLGVGRLRRDEPLAPLTTFRVGGPADWFIDIRRFDELQVVLATASHVGMPVTCLGGGSNVLVADAGVRGLVVRLKLAAIEHVTPTTVRAEAGVTVNGLVRWTVGRGLGALEAWAGTPGTVGGAIHGNAHWQGCNIGDLVSRVMLASSSGDVRAVAVDELEFAYDHSRLQHTKETLVWADFTVHPGEAAALRATARASLAFRKRTQPLALPSAGCVFQNPDPARDAMPAGVPASAGALIDRAGLKGTGVGGARISDVHANFIVTDGRATAADIRTLVERARDAVRDQFGVVLRDEVVYLGTFANG